MGKQDFEDFKDKMKQWENKNPKTYADFEQMMNFQPEKGMELIMQEAINIIPNYEDLINKMMNSKSLDGIDDIIKLFSEQNLGETIVNSFNAEENESNIPQIISWLYSGRSCETISENLEDIAQDPNNPRIVQNKVAELMNYFIEQSISQEIRTQDDWKRHLAIKSAVDKKAVTEWAINSNINNHIDSGKDVNAVPNIDIDINNDTAISPVEGLKSGVEADANIVSKEELESMNHPEPKAKTSNAKIKTNRNGEKLEFLLKDSLPKEFCSEKLKTIIEFIRVYISTNQAAINIAYLKIALEELLYIPPKTNIVCFRNALANQFDNKIEIRVARGIQEQMNLLNEIVPGTKKSEIRKDIEKHRIHIDYLKQNLSN